MDVLTDAWQSLDEDYELNHQDLDIYHLTTVSESSRLPRYQALLNAEELQRAARYHFEVDRNRFIIARGALRLILARYLCLAPEEIQFDYLKQGKPVIIPAQNPQNMQFNLSHSHEVILCGVHFNHPLGIDVEYMSRDCDYLEIAKRFFSAKEFEDLQSLPFSQIPLGFFSAWTRKEAFIKALGDGLSYPLKQFDVSLKPDSSAKILRIQRDPNAVKKWFLHAFRPQEEYVAAVALATTINKIHFWRWSL
ncbi:MAG: 4'-phosphopantetheinyl transferase superfamily protein [Legionellales bacterium]|nr:4'-phosphopantetheinyl transferase superfamily protein [Legionellales bacterium]